MSALRPILALGAATAILALATTGDDVRATQASPQLRLQQSPIDPTNEDCNELSQGYWAQISEQHRLQSQCMNSDPQIGPGLYCSLSNTLIQQTQAWPQCSSFQVSLCQLKQAADREVGICRARAADRSARERAQKEEQERAQRLADQLKRANDNFESAQKTHQLLTSPREFFKDLVEDRVRKGLDPKGNILPDDNEEAMRYAYTQALRPSGTDPVVNKFQEEAHKLIRGHFNDLTRKLKDTVSRMQALSVEMGRPARSTVNARPNRSSSPSPRNTADCDVLRDPDRSRALADSDLAAWLELQRRC